MKRLLLLTIALATLSVASAQVSIDRPYAVGADISWLQSQEARGTQFSDLGEAGDALDILRDNGFNYIRLRLFVNPRLLAARWLLRLRAHARYGQAHQGGRYVLLARLPLLG